MTRKPIDIAGPQLRTWGNVADYLDRINTVQTMSRIDLPLRAIPRYLISYNANPEFLEWWNGRRKPGVLDEASKGQLQWDSDPETSCQHHASNFVLPSPWAPDGRPPPLP